MDMIVVAVLASMVLGAPQGILLSLAAAVIAAAVRARGTLRERARGMLGMGFLRASVAFALAWLVLDEWQLVAIVWLIAAFIIDAWRGHGAASDRDRWGLVARFVAALAGFADSVAVYQLGHDANRRLARRRRAAGQWGVRGDGALVGAALDGGSAVAGAHAWPGGHPRHLRPDHRGGRGLSVPPAGGTLPRAAVRYGGAHVRRNPNAAATIGHVHS